MNPWQLISNGIGRFWQRYRDGFIQYPKWFAYWPALLFYMAFIWVELFGKTEPFSLAVVILIYSAINLLGAGLFGIRSWFRYAEFFAVTQIHVCLPL